MLLRVSPTGRVAIDRTTHTHLTLMENISPLKWVDA